MKFTKKLTILLILIFVTAFFAACSRSYEARVTNEDVLPSVVRIGDVDFGTVSGNSTTGYETFDDAGPHTIKLNSITATNTLLFNPFAAIFSGGSKKTVIINGPDITNVSVTDD